MSEAAAQIPQAGSDRRLLFFAKNKKLLSATVEHLKHQNFVVAVVDHLNDPMAAIKATNPGVVLLGWGLGADAVKRLFVTLQKEYPDKLVLVFGESHSPRDLASLTRSGITTTIFPPISGRGIQSRIENFIKKRARREAMDAVKKATADELPPDTEIEWKEVPVEPGSAAAAAGMKTYVSEAKQPGKKMPYTFYLDAKTPPSFNAATKRWEGMVADSIVAREEVHDVEEKAPAGDAPGPQTFADYRKPDAAEAGTIETSARKAASTVFQGNAGPENRKISNLATVGALLVNTPKHKGYLLMASADNSYQPEMLEAFGQKFFKDLGVTDEKTKAVKVDLEPISYNAWSDRLEFLAIFPHNGQDIAVLFVPSENLPTQSTEEKDLMNVSPQDNLFPGSKISFDLFLHMPKNSKYLLYLKRGSEVSEPVLDKLNKFNVKKMAIAKADLERFIAYLVNGVLTVADD